MRTPAHYNSHKPNEARPLAESNQFTAAMSIIHDSVCERVPVVIVVGLQMHRVAAWPVFDPISSGVRHSPMNPDGVNRFRCAEIDHHPLRMGVLRFSGEM